MYFLLPIVRWLLLLFVRPWYARGSWLILRKLKTKQQCWSLRVCLQFKTFFLPFYIFYTYVSSWHVEWIRIIASLSSTARLAPTSYRWSMRLMNTKNNVVFISLRWFIFNCELCYSNWSTNFTFFVELAVADIPTLCEKRISVFLYDTFKGNRKTKLNHTILHQIQVVLQWCGITVGALTYSANRNHRLVPDIEQSIRVGNLWRDENHVNTLIKISCW